MMKTIFVNHFDKVLHFVGGLVVCIVTATIFNNVFIGMGAVIVIGGLKETWYDLRHGTPSTADFIATTVGGLVGLVTTAFI